MQNLELEQQVIDAKKYWAEQGRQPLHYKRTSHYARAFAELSYQLNFKSVFEFGCASGRNLAFIRDELAKRDHDLSVHGIDINERAVKEGRERYNIDIKLSDEKALNELHSNTFDLVFTVSVLDHMPDPGHVVKALMSAANKFGFFLEPSFGGTQAADKRNEMWWLGVEQKKEPFPYTYYHDYKSLFSQAGYDNYAKVALPTHLNRSGSMYNLWIVPKEQDKKIDLSDIAHAATKASTLSLLSDIRSLSLSSTKTQEIKRYQSQLEFLEQQTASLTEEIKNLRSSVTFKLAKQLQKDMRRPLHWPLFPIKALRIYLQKRRAQLKKNISGRKSGPTNITSLLKLLPNQKNAPQINVVSKRICYVLHNSLPYATGGYATRSHGMALGLMDAGFEVICVTRPGFPLDVKNTAFKSSTDHEIDSVSYQRIEYPTISKNTLVQYMEASIEAWVQKLSELRPETVLLASSFRSALPAMIAAKRLGIPTAYEVRGFWEITRVSREPEFIKHKQFRNHMFMEAGVAQNADHVFTLTRAMKNKLVEYNVSADKITLLPNSVNVQKFTPVSRDMHLTHRLNIPDDTFIIGYIGSFVDYEGLEYIVEACQALFSEGINFRILIIGNENVSNNLQGPIHKNLKNIATRCGFEDLLIMPGRIPHEDVPKYYSLIDVVVFPRKSLPVTEMVSPLKPLEAMAMGKAIVGSSVAPLLEIIENEKTGLIFEKDSVKSLTEVLLRLARDPELRANLGKNARKFVEEERTWSTTARKAKFKLGIDGAE